MPIFHQRSKDIHLRLSFLIRKLASTREAPAEIRGQ